jgi:hypothetical protein
MPEVFELDAVEVVERAEARMQMDDDVAGVCTEGHMYCTSTCHLDGSRLHHDLHNL